MSHSFNFIRGAGCSYAVPHLTSPVLRWAFHRSRIILQSLNSSSPLLLQYSLFPRPLLSPVLPLSYFEKGVFSLRVLSINASSVFQFTPPFLPPSPFCLSLRLTVTWIGSVQATPSHWTSYSYTHVDTHRPTRGNLCMVQWFFSSATTLMHTLYSETQMNMRYPITLLILQMS